MILAALLCTAAFTGCAYEEMRVKINKNGSGSVSTTIGLKKELVGQITSFGGTDPFEGKETEEIEYDGSTYVTYTETKEYASFEEIKTALADMTYDTAGLEEHIENENDETVVNTENTDTDVIAVDQAAEVSENKETDRHIFKTVEIKKEGSSYIFSAMLNPVEGKVQGQELKDCFKFRITVEMPVKITAYKNGFVDGKTITFDNLDLSKETELYAESKTTSMIPAFIAIGLAAAAGVACIVLKKKKK